MAFRFLRGPPLGPIDLDASDDGDAVDEPIRVPATTETKTKTPKTLTHHTAEMPQRMPLTVAATAAGATTTMTATEDGGHDSRMSLVSLTVTAAKATTTATDAEDGEHDTLMALLLMGDDEADEKARLKNLWDEEDMAEMQNKLWQQEAADLREQNKKPRNHEWTESQLEAMIE